MPRTPTAHLLHRLVIAVAILSAGCTGSVPTAVDGISNPTDTSALATGPDAHVFVDAGYASTRLGDRWLVLEAVLSARSGRRIEVSRDAITVRTPSGLTLPLATQQEYAESYGDIRAAQLHPAVAEPSPRLFGAPRRSCGRWFFTPPAEGFAADSLLIEIDAASNTFAAKWDGDRAHIRDVTEDLPVAPQVTASFMNSDWNWKKNI